MVSISKTTQPLSGKKRELKERDELVLSLAQQIFLEEGYHAVTIEGIARILGFARGTLYQRFNCKEALFIELAIRCRQQINDAMEYASCIPGRPRERMVAIGEAVDRYARLYADNLRTMSVIDSEIILAKVEPEQAQRVNAADQVTFSIIMRIVKEAVEVGDLVLPSWATPGSLCLALSALIYGWAEVYRRPSRFEELGVANPAQDILLSAQRLMDGYQWQPLHTEWDYASVYVRVDKALLDFPVLNPHAAENIPIQKKTLPPER